MKRRGVVTGLVPLIVAFLLAPRATLGDERVWRLGVLSPGDSPWPSSSLSLVMMPDLAKRGFVDGRNLIVFPFTGSGNNGNKLVQLAQMLAAKKPDVIVAVSAPAIRAAMTVAPTTPIVASFTDDPVNEGFATNLARPCGTVTGIAMLAREGDRKRLEILHEAIPTARRFGYLARGLARSPGEVGADIQSMKRTAASFGVEMIAFEANSPSEYLQAFDAMHDARVEGVIIASSPVFFHDAAQLAALATERKLPTIGEWREMAGAGCLIGYGPDLGELRVRTADFVVRLFAGGKASEMPFEQPTHFVMGINTKTASSIGLTIPAPLLARADEVIE
jgi:putative ABC transport system substrate-binding protein